MAQKSAPPQGGNWSDPELRRQTLLASGSLLDPAQRGIFPGLSVCLQPRVSARSVRRLPRTLAACLSVPSTSATTSKLSEENLSALLPGRGAQGVGIEDTASDPTLVEVPTPPTSPKEIIPVCSFDQPECDPGRIPRTDPNDFFVDSPNEPDATDESTVAGGEHLVPYSVAGFDPTSALFQHLFLEPSFTSDSSLVATAGAGGGASPAVPVAFDTSSSSVSARSGSAQAKPYAGFSGGGGPPRRLLTPGGPVEVIALGGQGSNALTLTLRPQAPLPPQVAALYDTLNRSSGVVLGSAGIQCTERGVAGRPSGSKELRKEGLRDATWSGVPSLCRPVVWRLLLGYAPTTQERTARDLTRKRSEYLEYVQLYHAQDAAFGAPPPSAAGGGLGSSRARQQAGDNLSSSSTSDFLPHELEIIHQLSIDLPRHKLALFHLNPLVTRLSRVLYIWGIRYPAVGYVQGMDDVMSVFFIVFLADAIRGHLKRSKDDAQALTTAKTTGSSFYHRRTSSKTDQVKSRSLSSRTSSHSNLSGMDAAAENGNGHPATRHGNRNGGVSLGAVPTPSSLTSFKHHHADPSISSSTGVGVDLLHASSTGLFSTPAVRERLQTKTVSPGDAAVSGSGERALPTAQHMQLPDYAQPLETEALEALHLAVAFDAHVLGPIVAEMDTTLLDAAEADTYWTGGRMLSWVQNHFTNGQPGVKKLMASLESLLRSIDEPLIDALQEEGIFVAQFSFQWMHCLLQRELPLPLLVRLWDTYLALGEKFPQFHVYVCAALVMDLKPLVSCAAQGPEEADPDHLPLVTITLSPDQIQALFKKPAERKTVNGEGVAATVPMDVGWMEMIIAEAYLLQLKHTL